MKFPAILVCLAVSLGSSVSAITLDFETQFAGDILTELHTPDGDVCVFGDARCSEKDLQVPTSLRDPLAPFARIPDKKQIRISLNLRRNGMATCSFGTFFDCPSLLTEELILDEDEKPTFVGVADAIGDVAIQFDLQNARVDFFGAAGSYIVSGCSRFDPLADELPDGYCDFFGYLAEFSIASEPTITIGEPSGPISVVPLNASFVFSLFGLATLLAAKGLKRV